jgi:glycerophosphoryl diester phosphodiesterase
MKSTLIGHRGEPGNWPENSLPGFRSILEAGACLLETDIQITADGIAILSHDPSVFKITGSDLPVTATTYETLRALPAGYPQRFGDRFQDLRIARLDEFVELLQQWPNARAFIEIKAASISAHGIPTVVDTIIDLIRPVLPQCTLISFDHDVLDHTRRHYPLPIGWVLNDWSADNEKRARTLAPEYLFCNRKRLPPGNEPLWPGPWQWAVYTINAASDVPPLLERGVQFIETDSIRQLLADPALQGIGSV